jgi:hypothetical protein
MMGVASTSHGICREGVIGREEGLMKRMGVGELTQVRAKVKQERKVVEPDGVFF